MLAGPPESVGSDFCLESASGGGLAEGGVADGRAGQGLQGDQPGRSGDVGDDESLVVVQDGAGEEFGEGTVVAVVGAVEGVEVAVAGPFEDDCGRPAEPDQQQVQQQPAGASVAVEEGVDGLERTMQSGQPQRQGAGGEGAGGDVAPEIGGVVDPAVQMSGHLGPRWGSHAPAEGLDVVASEAARPLPRI